MKKTQVIEVGKNIKRTKVSFVSILIFVILGAAIYLGLTWSADAFRLALGKEMNLSNTHDLSISFPYGIDDEGIEELLDIELVDQAEGVESVYQLVTVGSETVVANVKSLTSDINTIYNLEGRLPIANNEIVIETECAHRLGLSIGDKVSFFGDGAVTSYELSKIKDYNDEVDLEDYMHTEDAHYFNEEEFTIVGMGNSGEYITTSAIAYGVSPSDSLQVSVIFYVNYEAFNPDTVKGYNTVVIRNEEASKLYVFDDEYKEISNILKENIKETANRIAEDGYKKVKGNYDAIVEDTGKLIEDGNKNISDGEKEIEDGKVQIKDAKKKLADAKIELDDAKKQLDEASITLNNGKAEYARGKEKYDSVKEALDNSYELIDTITNDEDSSLLSDLIRLGKSDDLDILLSLANDSDMEISSSDEMELNSLRDQFYDRTIDFMVDYANICLIEAPSEGGTELYNDVMDIKNKYDSGWYEKEEAFRAFFRDTDGENSSVAYRAALLYVKVADKVGTLYADYKQDLGDLANQMQVITDRILADSKKKLDAAANEIAAGEAKLNAGYAEYNEGLDEYNSGLKTVKENEQKLADAEVELEDAKARIIDATIKYEELKDAGSSLIETSAVILTRFDMPSVYTTGLVADCVNNEKYSLGGLFLIIALLICYSVITRNVNNDIKLLGTKKALGFNRREVTMTYLVYTGIAVVGGLVLGILMARFIVEPLVVSLASNGLFIFETTGDYFGVLDTLILCAVEFVALEAITIYGCNDILKRSAVKLLQGPEPPKTKQRFYESWKIWQRLPLLTKTIINNCFNDPRRVFAMLVGVSGCTALVVASLVFCFDVKSEFALQTSEIYRFDSFLYFDRSDETKEELGNLLAEEEITGTPVLRTDVYIAYEGSDYFGAHLFVYEDSDAFYDLYYLITMEYEECERDVVAIPESIEQHFDLSAGDYMTITTLDGSTKEMEVGTFYRQSGAFLDVIMSQEIYESLFNKEYVANAYMIDSSAYGLEEIKEKAAEIDGYYYTYDLKTSFLDNASIFDMVAVAIVGVYLVVSVLMAIFVLLNLMMTFVMEKKRELITLMINGFSKKQAHAYIYSDTILLTAIGILLGLGLGYEVGTLSIKLFESEYMLFNREFSGIIVLIAILFTSVLTTVMTWFALKQIDKFSLTDINKN